MLEKWDELQGLGEEDYRSRWRWQLLNWAARRAASSHRSSWLLYCLRKPGRCTPPCGKYCFPRHLTTSCSGTREGGIKDKALYAPAQVLTW